MDDTGTQMAAHNNEFSYEPLYLKVEDSIFCVNRITLIEDSEFFSELFEVPPPPDKPVEGSTKEHPLRIEGVSKDDMILFLHAIFPKHLFATDKVSCWDWIRVMRLLTMWRFKQSRNNLLQKLRLTAQPATKIVMWHEFLDLSARIWLIEPMNVLLRRATSC